MSTRSVQRAVQVLVNDGINKGKTALPLPRSLSECVCSAEIVVPEEGGRTEDEEEQVPEGEVLFLYTNKSGEGRNVTRRYALALGETRSKKCGEEVR